MEAVSGTQNADTIAVMLDSGIANIYLLTPSLEKNLSSLQSHVPKRKSANDSHDGTEKAFFKTIMTTLDSHVGPSTKLVILAGPGFVKDKFSSFLKETVTAQSSPNLVNRSEMFVLVQCSSANKQSLKEVLTSETLKSRLLNTKAATHVRALESFYKMLNNDPHRACFGPAHCAFAVDRGAVQTILLTDSLFRSSTAAKRRKFNDLTEQVSHAGGEVFVFSELHTSGQQLASLTGIACILRYPLPELENWDGTTGADPYDGGEGSDSEDFEVDSEAVDLFDTTT
eukprot:GHVN01034602.1.p3 GENE.GHVN01034602.1~~GHVN01034602.1.p3  ORF type:complete len:284 (+),score=38.47 GHVN01034602.1:2864-3715(+)